MLLTAYLALGCLVGVVAGLLGVGGGLIMVPILAFLFGLHDFAVEHIMQLALGTSLAVIVFTSVSSALAHHRRGAVRWPLVMQLSLGFAVGGWLGGVLAVWLGGALLALLFGLFELAVAAQMMLGHSPAPGRSQPGTMSNALAGVVIGAVSALLGIGGATLTVPWLTWHNLDMRAAVGTSAACGLPIALVGAAGFVAAGWGRADLPAAASGYVYWPAVAGISIASVTSAPLGARLAHYLDQRRLKRVFAGFVAGLGVLMIARSLLA